MTGFPSPGAGMSYSSRAGLEPVWVPLAEVTALHERQAARFGGPADLRDAGALESALGRARNKWAYEGVDLAQLAAAQAFGIARNRPFVAGNERAAFVTLMLFLRRNGVRFAPAQAEATILLRGLAAGEVGEDGLARWIRDRWPA